MNRQGSTKGCAEADGRILHADTVAHPDADQGEGYVQHRQEIRQRAGIVVQMPHRRAEADGVVQHDALVHKQHAGGADQHSKDAPVAAQGIGHAQQENRREQITFVHLDAQHVQHDEQHCTAKGQVFKLAGTDEDGQHDGERHGHGCRAKDGPAAACDGSDQVENGIHSH